jgi:hypothetical protein
MSSLPELRLNGKGPDLYAKKNLEAVAMALEMDTEAQDARPRERSRSELFQANAKRPSLPEIQAIVAHLEYGEMMDLAAQLWAKRQNQESPGITLEDLPGLLHRWSKPDENPGSVREE